VHFFCGGYSIFPQLVGRTGVADLSAKERNRHRIIINWSRKRLSFFYVKANPRKYYPVVYSRGEIQPLLDEMHGREPLVAHFEVIQKVQGLTAQLCHALTGEWNKYSNSAGVSRPRLRRDDDDLPARDGGSERSYFESVGLSVGLQNESCYDHSLRGYVGQLKQPVPDSPNLSLLSLRGDQVHIALWEGDVDLCIF